MAFPEEGLGFSWGNCVRLHGLEGNNSIDGYRIIDLSFMIAPNMPANFPQIPDYTVNILQCAQRAFLCPYLNDGARTFLDHSFLRGSWVLSSFKVIFYLSQGNANSTHGFQTRIVQKENCTFSMEQICGTEKYPDLKENLHHNHKDTSLECGFTSSLWEK